MHVNNVKIVDIFIKTKSYYDNLCLLAEVCILFQNQPYQEYTANQRA